MNINLLYIFYTFIIHLYTFLYISYYICLHIYISDIFFFLQNGGYAVFYFIVLLNAAVR